jgi:nucleoside-diphosphate-sugar epimerase
VPAAYANPARFFVNNTMTTLTLLEACAASRVQRFLYVSSTEVYGDRGEVSLDERVALDPVNTYAVSKLAADRLCHTYALEHGLDVKVARIFNAYGPRETHAYIIPEIIQQLSVSPRLQLGRIDVARDFTFVEDTAEALMRLLETPVLGQDVYNVGSGVSRPIRTVIDVIAREMRIADIAIVTDEQRLRRRDIASFICDHAALARDTGWAPRVAFADGIARTVAWFEANGRTWPWKSFDQELAVAGNGARVSHPQR